MNTDIVMLILVLVFVLIFIPKSFWHNLLVKKTVRFLEFILVMILSVIGAVILLFITYIPTMGLVGEGTVLYPVLLGLILFTCYVLYRGYKISISNIFLKPTIFLLNIASTFFVYKITQLFLDLKIPYDFEVTWIPILLAIEYIYLSSAILLGPAHDKYTRDIQDQSPSMSKVRKSFLVGIICVIGVVVMLSLWSVSIVVRNWNP